MRDALFASPRAARASRPVDSGRLLGLLAVAFSASGCLPALPETRGDGCYEPARYRCEQYITSAPHGGWVCEGDGARVVERCSRERIMAVCGTADTLIFYYEGTFLEGAYRGCRFTHNAWVPFVREAEPDRIGRPTGP